MLHLSSIDQTHNGETSMVLELLSHKDTKINHRCTLLHTENALKIDFDRNLYLALERIVVVVVVFWVEFSNEMKCLMSISIGITDSHYQQQ